MTKLTVEDLAKLYPRAKTYDEIQAEHEARRERRRPKFVAVKISCQTSLALLVAALAYRISSQIAATTSTSVGGILAGISFGLLTLVLSATALYYLYKSIDGLASKTIVATSPLYAIILGILSAAGLVYVAIEQVGYGEIGSAAAAAGLTFASTYLVVRSFLRQTY